MVKIFIDDKEVEAETGSMIIEAADKAGIHIPRFCYHKKLSIAANCRMCLVEVEKSRKPLPACATPITEGMCVFTQSKMALESQRAVMEFLLINHPLDCPICDQGGQCELQDVSMGFGEGVSDYTQGKRSVNDDDLGSLISTEMTRCIHCTRCVRFGEEVAGVRELGLTQRGENAKITTYVQHAMKSEVSGNIIDLCPVGALTSKPFRFRARAWELQSHDAIAPHDCLGSNTKVQTRRGIVMRVNPKENESINETWLSDRDRFAYQGYSHEERLGHPMIKRGGKWHSARWSEALEFVNDKVRDIIKADGPESVAGFISPSSTIEEQYLFQKWCRALGTNHVDHRVRQTDYGHQDNIAQFPSMGAAIAEFESFDTFCLIGSNIQQEQPLLALRIRKAVNGGAKVVCCNPIDFDFCFDVAASRVTRPHRMTNELAGILKVLSSRKGKPLDERIQRLISDVEPTPEAAQFVDALEGSGSGIILLGALAANHSQASTLYCLAEALRALTGFRIGFLTEGANTAGAWISGCVPHRTPLGTLGSGAGLPVAKALEKGMSCYFLYNLEPGADFANPYIARSQLEKANLVVAFSPYYSTDLRDVVDVILPIAPPSEMSGTFVNGEGRWQSFQAQVKPYEQARPGWKVLRVLGNYAELPDFDYDSVEQVHYEIKQLSGSFAQAEAPLFVPDELLGYAPRLTRVSEWPIYRGDNVVRRAEALQASATQPPIGIRMSAAQAKELSVSPAESIIVQQHGEPVHLTVVIDERIPEGCVYVPAGFAESAELGESFGSIEIMRG